MTTPADKPIEIPAQLILDIVKTLTASARISMSRMIAFDYGLKTEIRNFNRGNASTRSKYEISSRLHEACRTAISDAEHLDRVSAELGQLWLIASRAGIHFADYFDMDQFEFAVGQINMKPQAGRIKDRVKALEEITLYHISLDPTTL